MPTSTRYRVPHSITGITPFFLVIDSTPSLNNVRVFGCAAFVLKVNRRIKFESRALQGVYLQSLEHAVYEVLLADDDDVPRIVKSRHVKFDDSSFPRAPYLENYMEDDVIDSGSTSNFGSVHAPEIHATEEVLSDVVSHGGDSSCACSPADSEEIDGLEPEPESRYPHRTCREPQRWWHMEGTTMSEVEVPTSDDPTLK